MISADRTVVTFKPKAGMESIKHPFWKPNKHDGTRIYIHGSDLSSLKTGQYSIKAHVACGSDINDLSCLADQSVPEGIPFAPSCPTTTAPPTQCQYIGTHDGGSNPNWWQAGNAFEYQGYINIPLSSGSRSPVVVPDWDPEYPGSIAGGWYIDLTFQNPVETMHFWSGQAEKMDEEGYKWRLTGWCNQTWSNSIDLTYIGVTNTSGINSLASFSKSF